VNHGNDWCGFLTTPIIAMHANDAMRAIIGMHGIIDKAVHATACHVTCGTIAMVPCYSHSCAGMHMMVYP
jgi:hypothetical protein